MSILTVDELLQAATARTGLSDFGGDDFLEGFGLLVSSIRTQGEVPEDRREPFNENLLRLLVNRLWFAKDVAENPEILEQHLLPPVAIVSMPRTGTSKLQRILGTTDSFQNSLFWHVHMFARIPGMVDGGNAQRLREARQYEAWTLKMSPDFNQGHPMHAEEVEEEIPLTEFGFRTPHMGINLRAPDYLQWIASTDLTPTYDYLLSQLKYLQWQFDRDSQKPWLLKSPMHIGNEAQLTRLFPQGMKFICPHRSPEQLIASVARTAELFQYIYYGDVERDKHLGAMVMLAFGGGLKAHMAWRDQNPSVAILDLSFKDITRNSVETAEQVYQFLDIPLTDEHKDNIAAWDKENPRNKHGKNLASLADYGLTEKMIEETFENYCQRFRQYL